MLVLVSELQTYMDIKFSMRQIDAAELVIDGLQSEMEAYLRRPIQEDEFTEQHVIPSYFQGVPATSFFYDASLDSTGNGMNYIQPSVILNMRNTPVILVKSVKIKSLADTGTFLAEAQLRKDTVTNAVQTGTSVTFTASAHGFTIGQYVTMADILPATYQTSSKVISSVTVDTFTLDGYPANLSAFVSGGEAKAAGNDYTVHRYGLELYRGFPNDVVEVTYTGGLNGDAIKMFKLFILRAATREMQNMHDDTVGIKDLTTRNVAPMETGFSERELLALRRWRRRRI